MALLPKARRLASLALLGVLGFLVLANALAFALQERLIFPAPWSATPPEVRGAALLRLPSPRGEVVALHLPAAEGAATAVFFHGNGEEVADFDEWVRALGRHGLGVLAVEYPGYGLSRGSGPPGEAQLYEAAEIALGHLRERLGVPVERTVLVGHSLGTGVATEMALRGRGARLVLLSPFTTLADAAGRFFPYLPVRLLLRHRFESAAKAPRIGVPVLIAHGARDGIIPVEMGERLSRAFPRAQLVILPAADHAVIAEVLEPLARCVADFARERPCALP